MVHIVTLPQLNTASHGDQFLGLYFHIFIINVGIPILIWFFADDCDIFKEIKNNL